MLQFSYIFMTFYSFTVVTFKTVKSIEKKGLKKRVNWQGSIFKCSCVKKFII